MHLSRNVFVSLAVPGTALVLILGLSSCSRPGNSRADLIAREQVITVGVTKVERRSLQRELTVSSELVPFQEIEVYAKESGYVSQLLVDYGARVKTGQLMAVLEIPELQALLQQDRAALKSMQDQVTNAQNQLTRLEAQHKVLHLEFERLNGVAQSKPGLVAQQEVDDVQGRDLAAEAQVQAAQSNLEAARSNVTESEAKLAHDEAIYSYSRITAPFDGVVTERDANLGTLMQAGTNSSTNVLPLVKLSQENLYRLVIPVPETYVSYIRIGDEVSVRVPALNKNFPGKVARFSSEVHDTTRTMHTEVNVPNPTGELIPGVYAEARLTLNSKGNALTIPVQAIDREGDHTAAFVVDSSNRIQICPVVLGIEDSSENYAEVLSGLNEGEKVVVGDRSGLQTGEVVRPQQATPAAYQGRT
ncbi:MAG TPA: efflux RND transporter periplasmic adaptor subunit [Bryobacteraceae bacterium]|nr:efflux RND transporter periplasmic adaptor subunit [Bryobacteraceae bacterium]